MEQIVLSVLGPLALVALVSGLIASAVTKQVKSNLRLSGWQALLVQVVLAGVIAVLLVTISAQGAPPDGWVLMQAFAAGLAGGLMVATGWDFAGRLASGEIAAPSVNVQAPAIAVPPATVIVGGAVAADDEGQEYEISDKELAGAASIPVDPDIEGVD